MKYLLLPCLAFSLFAGQAKSQTETKPPVEVTPPGPDKLDTASKLKLVTSVDDANEAYQEYVAAAQKLQAAQQATQTLKSDTEKKFSCTVTRIKDPKTGHGDIVCTGNSPPKPPEPAKK